MSKSITQITEIGRERQCTKCDEFWPDDEEFFYLKAGKTCQPCKACYAQLPSRRARQKHTTQTARPHQPQPMHAAIHMMAMTGRSMS